MKNEVLQLISVNSPAYASLLIGYLRAEPGAKTFE